MFHPESNPLAPKPTGPKKPEKELVEIWLGKEAAALMEDEKPEMGDEDLNSKKHELTKKEKKALWEMKRPDEVTLRNIPRWKKLPDVETIERDFKFQYVIWKAEFRERRPLSDFTPRPEETLPSFQGLETLAHAKVFDITDAIAKAKEKDIEHRDSLSTSEVLEAIDAAGYRPATLEELLAYARDHWKPDVNPKSLTRAERELQNTQSSHIIGLGSVFSEDNGVRLVPRLRYSHDERDLSADVLGDRWLANGRFLVLRKSSPS